MRLLLAITIALGVGRAQPEFEVASVKPAGPMTPGGAVGMRGGPGTNDPGQISWNYVTLQDVVLRAYDLKAYQLSAPSWLDSAEYDITAKVPPGTSKEQFQLMLQNLLAQRFHLKAHRETREGTVYELVAGKNGPRFTPSAPQTPAAPQADPAPANQTLTLHHAADGVVELPASMHGKGHIAIRSFRGTEIRVRGEGLGYLIERLGAELHRPVIDKTGLAGEYDYAMAFMPETQAATTSLPPEDRPPDLFTALQSYLGLKLEARKISGEVLVVDQVDKTPTEN